MTRERAATLLADDWRSRNPEVQEPKLSQNLALVERLREVGALHGRSPGQVAIAWTLRHPAVTGAIVGARSARQVEVQCIIAWTPRPAGASASIPAMRMTPVKSSRLGS